MAQPIAPPILHYDDTASRLVESIYATSDVVAQRRAVLEALALQPGACVLDVGAGPGFLAIEMADAVGPNGRVVGVDVSESMLALATARAERCGQGLWVEFRLGEAVRLPVSDASFDVAAATQVYEYVIDVEGALAELHRALRPGGRALILDTDWDSIVWHSDDRPRTDHVLWAWEEHLVDPHLPRRLAVLLRAAGFQLERQDVITLFNPALTADTYSAGLIDLIAAFVPGHRGVTVAEAAAWAADLRQHGERDDYFFSLSRYLFVGRKPPA